MLHQYLQKEPILKKTNGRRNPVINEKIMRAWRYPRGYEVEYRL